MPESSLIRLLIRKLENFAELTEEEKAALFGAAGPVRAYGSHEDLIREGDHAQDLRHAAMIEHMHGDAGADQLRRDIGLQVRKPQHQVRRARAPRICAP